MLKRDLAAINSGHPYTALTPNVLADYAETFGTAIYSRQVIAVSVKIIHAATGLSSDYLRFVVEPQPEPKRRAVRRL